MGAEVLFKDAKGKELYLPQSTGEKMGLTVSEAYVPEELKEKPESDTLASTGKEQTEQERLSDAIATVHSIASRGAESVDSDAVSGLDMLAHTLLNYGFGVSVLEGNEEQTGEPSLVDAIKLVEAQIDASAKITDNNKEVTKKQLAKMLEPAE